MPSSLVSAPTECDTHRFREFDIHDVVYKTVNGCNIPASVLVRKSCRDGRHPVIVRWHGGGLVNGHRLYGQWAAPYILEFARRTDAIMVFPDYRLLPGIESSLDVLDDVTDFFAWLFAGGISGVLDPRISADLDSVLVCGESAGGWLALQSGFLQKDGRIRAIIAQYPMIDMRDGHWSASGTHKYLQGAAFVNPEDLEKYYSEEEKTVSSRVPPGGGEIYLSLVQRGLYSKAFGEDSSLYPLELLDRQSHSLPPLWLLHGSGDTIVPATGSIKFADKLQRTQTTPCHFTIRHGEDHLFDVDTNIDEQWAREGLAFISKHWPVAR